MLLRVLIPLGSILLASCAGPPRVGIAGDARIEQRTAAAAAGVVPVKVTNPNDRSIQLVEFTYIVTAQNGTTWNGRHAAGLVLSPGFDRIAELPVVLPPGARPGQTLRVGGSLHFLDTSTFAETLAEWGYRPTASFGGHTTIAGAAGPMPE